MSHFAATPSVAQISVDRKLLDPSKNPREPLMADVLTVGVLGNLSSYLISTALIW